MPVSSRKKASYRDFREAISKIERSKSLTGLSHLFCIHGDVEVLRDQACQALRDLWRQDNSSPDQPGDLSTESSVQSVEGSDLIEDSFAQLWQQNGMFEPQTLYFIRRADQNRSLSRLLKMIDQASSVQNPIVLVMTKAPLAATQKELARLGACHIPCAEPWRNEATSYIKGRARAHGIEFLDDAVQLIIENIGFDLAKIENSVRHLSLLCAQKGGPLAAGDIGPHLGVIREDHAFRLDDLLVSKQWQKAHILVADLLARGESSLQILGLFARYCRLSLQVAACLKEGNRQAGDIAYAMKIPLFVAKKYTPAAMAAGVHDRQRWRSGLQSCSAADAQLKSSSLPDDLVLGSVLQTISGHESLGVGRQ